MSIQKTVVRIKDWIIQQIDDEQFTPFSPLPSVFEMSRALDVSQDKVEEALHELVTEQILTEKFQEGYFVKGEPIFFYPVDELKSITKMIEEKNCTPGTIIISQDPETPSLDDKRLLQIDDDLEITVIERVRTADGQPVAYCLDKIRKADFSFLSISDNVSLFDELQHDEQFHIAYADCEIEAISFEPYISGVLECTPEESLLLLKQVHYNTQDEPVLLSLNYFKSSQMKFQIKREMK